MQNNNVLKQIAKHDFRPSGTEGRPGSPSSLDGDSRLEDDNQQPVTGIGKLIIISVLFNEKQFLN